MPSSVPQGIALMLLVIRTLKLQNFKVGNGKVKVEQQKVLFTLQGRCLSITVIRLCKMLKSYRYTSVHLAVCRFDFELKNGLQRS